MKLGKSFSGLLALSPEDLPAALSAGSLGGN